MNWRTAIFSLASLCALGCVGSSVQAQTVVVNGGPFGPSVVISRPTVAVAPAYPTYSVGSSYSVGYGGYSAYTPYSSYYSGYGPVVSAAYVAPAPVVTYRPVVPAVVPVYPAYRPGIISTRAYYPGQPVRNALRVIAP